jgi:hypothetical protein
MLLQSAFFAVIIMSAEKNGKRFFRRAKPCSSSNPQNFDELGHDNISRNFAVRRATPHDIPEESMR